MASVRDTIQGHGVRNVFLPPTPVDIVGQASLSGAEKEGLLLSDQAYYDRFTRPDVERLRQQAEATAGATRRASSLAQGDFLTAQGLGGTTVAQAAERSLVGPFQRAQRQAMDAARMEAEELTRRKFADRQRRLQEYQKGIALAGSLEAQIASGVLAATPMAPLAPLAAAEATTKGTLYSLAPEAFLSQANRGADPLREVDFSVGAGRGGNPASAYDRGGGGSDFYRTYGG